ncbi:MAG: insulinase family protein [Spirochaetaceae bacterium]|nr:insulinase family protein [Spirochaetaceae bacterium]
MLNPITLPSGGTLLAERRRGSPSFTVAVVFPFGSRNESSKSHGFCHFIEHMLFKGTSRHDSLALWSLIENTGGYINGFTDRDAVTLYCSVPSPSWRLALNLLTEMAFSSVFPRPEFEKEREIIRSEIRQAEDEVEDKAFDSLLAHYWKGDSASLEIAGTENDLASIKYEDLLRMYHDFFTPSNAIFAVTGSEEPDQVELALEGAIEAALNGLDSGHVSAGRAGAGENLAALLPARTPIAHPFAGRHKVDCSQVYYFEAFQLDPPFEPADYPAMGIISSLVGEASTSRLFQRIRERLGLAYAVQSSYSFSGTECLLTIQACTDASTFLRCRAEIDTEMESVLAFGFSESEISDARERLAGTFRLAMEDPEFRIRRLVHDFLAFGRPSSVSKEVGAIRSISRDRIEIMLRKLEKAPRCRYAYGKLSPKIARQSLLQEI